MLSISNMCIIQRRRAMRWTQRVIAVRLGRGRLSASRGRSSPSEYAASLPETELSVAAC